MPHRGLPICYHTEEDHKRVLVDYPEGLRVEESRCANQFWLIQTKSKPWLPLKRLIECKYCGKQRWTATQWLVQALEPKPEDTSLPSASSSSSVRNVADSNIAK